MPLKPPTGTTDAVARYLRAMTAPAPPHALTGTQIKARTASSSRPRRLASRPDCAVCGKPVEEFTEEEGFLDRFVVFIARCHGESERVRVELETIKDGRVSFGLAFVPPNTLPPAAPPRLLGPGGPPHVDCDCISCRAVDDLMGWNPRYLAYARANGTPDPKAMMERDDVLWPGGRMTGFVLWLNELWREWGAELGIPAHELRYNELPDAGEWFDLWLQARYPEGGAA